MTKDEALKLALEALEGADQIDCDMREAITAIKEALAQPEQTNTRPYYTIAELNAWADEKEKQAWRNAAIRIGEELSSVGPDGYYDMNAWQWLDWAMENVKKAQPEQEQEPVAWEQFYPDIGKPQIEQPKVRTGDCLLVGVCASEGHKIQKAQPEQEPVAWGVFEGNLHDMFFTEAEAVEMAQLKGNHAEVRPLYTTPPQRKPLTLGQKQRLWSSVGDKPTLKDRVNAYGLAIEAAHGIKE